MKLLIAIMLLASIKSNGQSGNEFFKKYPINFGKSKDTSIFSGVINKKAGTHLVKSNGQGYVKYGNGYRLDTIQIKSNGQITAENISKWYENGQMKNINLGIKCNGQDTTKVFFDSLQKISIGTIGTIGMWGDGVMLRYSDTHSSYIESVTPCKIDTVPCIMMVSDTTLRGNVSVYSIRGVMTVQRGTCFTYNYNWFTSEYFDRQRLPLKLFVWMSQQIK